MWVRMLYASAPVRPRAWIADARQVCHAGRACREIARKKRASGEGTPDSRQGALRRVAQRAGNQCPMQLEKCHERS
jgi:hypothetical protein